MFSFKIVSTVEVSDHADKIVPGTVLYEGDEEDHRPTEAMAYRHAEDVLNGLDGGRAFNIARDSARIETALAR